MTPTGVQITSFENFAALESYLKATKVTYEEALRKYEELLGGILRDSKSTSSKKVQEKWVYEIQASMEQKNGKTAKQHKEDGKAKSQNMGTGEWVMLDPLSVFVGHKNRGIAELYFEVITELRETVSQLTLATSVVAKLKLKASSMGNNSLLVSFVRDVPNKVVLKPAAKSAERYSVVYNFALSAARPIRNSIVSN